MEYNIVILKDKIKLYVSIWEDVQGIWLTEEY